MRPKLSIKLIYKEKDNFLDFLKTVLKNDYTEEEGLYYFNIPESEFNISDLDLINALLSGLAKVIVSDEGEKALLSDAQYIKGENVELWVNPNALETAKKYLERKESL